MNTKHLGLAVVQNVILMVLVARPASSQCPVTIDTFSTGSYSRSLRMGGDDATQTGAGIIGGVRRVNWLAGPPVTGNPFNRLATLEIATPNPLLIFEAGFEVNWATTILWGNPGTPVDLDLNLSACNNFRFNIEGTDGGIVVIMTIWTGGGLVASVAEDVVPPSPTFGAFNFDIPFTSFVSTDPSVPTDFSNVRGIAIDLRAGHPIASDDFGIRSIGAQP